MSRTRTRRPARWLVAVAAVATLLPATAGADPGSHVRGDGGGTGRQVASGPATAGQAWRTDLGVRLENEPQGSFLASNGLAIFQGRDVADNRGKLYAIDPSDGAVAWGGDPALDIAWGCPGVATSDGRVLVHADASSTLNPTPDSELVALDATTGERIPGDVYNGEAEGDERLNPCQSGQRLVLSPDESLVVVAGNMSGRRIRAIDTDTFTQAWEVVLQDVDGSTSPPIAAPVVVSDDGEGLYVVYRWDPEGSVQDQTWRLERFDLADGSSDGFVDLPGSTYVAFTATTTLAADGGVVLRLTSCDGAPASAPNEDCLVMFDDDAGDFTLRWTTYTPPDGSRLATSLALMDADTVGGFGAAGATPETRGLDGYDLDTGAIEWSTGTPFSNNGQQFITDPDGNGYFGGFGEYHARSVDPDGRIRWGIEHCHLTDGLEPAIVGPIGLDGTLVTMARDPDNDAKEVFRGFRTGAELPRGSCPEEEQRVAGINRVETAVEISNVSFAAAADTVVLATATNYPDALAGGPLARRLDAPLLLTDPTALSPETRDEIERLGASRVVLLGGTVALSAAVEAELRDDMGLAVERIAGENRFETAQLISQRVPATTAYVTEGANADPARGWPDAVAVSGLASFEQRPILLVTRDGAPPETLEALDDLGATTAVVVGGEAAVSASTAAAIEAQGVTVQREAGATRYATSVEVARRSQAAGATTLELWFATGLSFPDALAAGPAVAKAGGILVLVHGLDTAGGPEVYAYLEGLDDDRVLSATFVGGVAAITDEVASRLLSAAGIQP